MAHKTKAPAALDDVAEFHALMARGEQYQRDVATAFAEMGVELGDPAWIEWCAQMDAWRDATS